METIEINGWLNIDKPYGFSSAKVVAIVKRLLKAKKVGHGGTLDPLASGVLPICINKATKTTEKTMNFSKEYFFNITFGEERTTADAEGKVIKTSNIIPTENEIKNILNNFIGEIQQTPPIYSAIKVNGKRAYDLARNNQNIELQARLVKVFELNFLGFENEKTAKFSVKCGKGFYIRSLAVDISKALNTVGYVSYLRRTEVGIFNKDNMITLEKLKTIYENNELEKYLINL